MQLIGMYLCFVKDGMSRNRQQKITFSDIRDFVRHAMNTSEALSLRLLKFKLLSCNKVKLIVEFVVIFYPNLETFFKI